MSYPSRIVCLTEETTETLYLLGEGDRVVGVSGYTVRPTEARRKPRVSAFINAKFEKIAALCPDLILGFSDLQADIAAELIKRGYPVCMFNQRSVPEILQMIQMVGALVGRSDRASELVSTLERRLEAVRTEAAQLPRRPRIFFEEWDTPLISGIRWVKGHPHLSRAASRRSRSRTHRRSGRRHPTRSGRYRGFLVRQGCSARANCQSRGLEHDLGGTARTDLRDQVRPDPATRARGAHRRPHTTAGNRVARRPRVRRASKPALIENPCWGFVRNVGCDSGGGNQWLCVRCRWISAPAIRRLARP